MRARKYRIADFRSAIETALDPRRKPTKVLITNGATYDGRINFNIYSRKYDEFLREFVEVLKYKAKDPCAGAGLNIINKIVANLTRFFGFFD